MASVPDAVTEPDAIIAGLKNGPGLDQVFSVKTLAEGTVLVVEEVRTGKRVLALESAGKVPGAKNAKELLPSVLLNARDDAEIGAIGIDRPAGIKPDQSAFRGSPGSSISARDAKSAGPAAVER